jgi:hypothetical protein
MLAISASEASTDAKRLAAEAEQLGRACREAGSLLVLGGSGAWPAEPHYGTCVRDLGTLHRLGSTWRASVARSRPRVTE